LSVGRPRFDPSVNYYQVLNVSVSASSDEITRSYRSLIRVTHPDNFQDAELRLKAEERTKLINAAYSVLSRPDLRVEYDKVVRQTIMSEALMQRYTGNAPGRPAPFSTPPRPAPRHITRRQRTAFNSAVWQLVLTAAGVFFGLVAIVLIGSLAADGLHRIF
jgi:curved DNA-binding protein CbpA